MNKEKSCGAIIFNEKNEVLVIKHNAGHWDFPKGHVEENETEIETAKREVKEETNLDIEIIGNYRYKITYSPKEGVMKDVIYFIARNTSNNVKIQEKEVSDYGWYNYSDALDILTFDMAKNLLKKAYKDLKKEI